MKHLTARQQEVLRLLAEGKKNRDIAQALNLSVAVVGNQIYALYGLLGVENRVQAARWYVEHDPEAAA